MSQAFDSKPAPPNNMLTILRRMAANWHQIGGSLPSYNPGKLLGEQLAAARAAWSELSAQEQMTLAPFYQRRLENDEERAERERKEAARVADDNVTPLANTKQALDFVLGRTGYARHDLVAIAPAGSKAGIEACTFGPGPDERERMKAWIDGWQGKWNLYFVANEVRADAPRNKRTSKKDIGRLHFVWTDSDAKDAPGDTPEQCKEHRLAQLRQEFAKYTAFQPSVIVDSGGGFHPYWRIEPPIENTDENRALVEGIGDQLRQMFGGDDVSDVGQILRLPGTINMKTKDGRVPVPSALINGGSNGNYTIDQLKAWAPPLATSKSQAAHKTDRKPRETLQAHEWLEQEALFRIKDWAPHAFPGGRWSGAAWRVPPDALCRGCEEHLSIHPDGIRDFGQEFGERVGYSPVKLLQAFFSGITDDGEQLVPVEDYDDDGAPIGGTLTVDQAQNWLCARLGMDWQKLRQEDLENTAGFEAVVMVRRDLKTNKNGSAADTYENAVVAISTTGLKPRWDELKQIAVLTAPTLPWKADKYGRGVDDHVLRVVRAHLVNVYQAAAYQPSKENVYEAIMYLAFGDKFNPVLDYLDGLQWDGEKRVERLFPDYFNGGDDEFTRAASTCFMVGAVRRMRRPGCKFDTMPVLRGPQGLGKSSGVKELFGEQRFSDADLGSLHDKDAAMLLRGIWCQEFAEMDSLNKSESSTLKAFVSRAVDRMRDPYARTPEDVRRRCVFIGTVNEGGYLKDLTGARRFWPIEVSGTIDVARIAADRDQLWAEAARLEAQGTSDVLPQELWDIAAERQAEQTSGDPWADTLQGYLEGGGVDLFKGTPMPPRRAVYTSQLFEALGIADADGTKDKAQRIRTIMESKSIGWHYRRAVRVDGGKPRPGYTREPAAKKA